MTPYRRGVAFERRVRTRLERLGWTVVRAAGSHGPVDLVAWPPRESPLAGIAWGIQVKAGTRGLDRAGRQALRAWQDATGTVAVWVYPLVGGRIWRWTAWDPTHGRWVPVDPARWAVVGFGGAGS